MEHLLTAYALCAATEGQSKKSIAIVTHSVSYLADFLLPEKGVLHIAEVTHLDIRAFILYLRSKRRFDNHPWNHPSESGLSGHTINTYLRSIRSFFSWLATEEIIESNPFDRVKIPKPPSKVIATFSEAQIRQLLEVIDTATPAGFRDRTMILMLLDCGLRVSELTGLRLPDVSLEDGLLKVLGKGNKERLVPMGKQVAQHLWRYVGRYRPEPCMPRMEYVFLTCDGRPLNKNRIEKIMKAHGTKAGISGVRCSPHTFRHTAAVTFLRNGGDVFSLQRMLGHSSLEMTRRYCQLADVDVKRAHMTASPVDNLDINQGAHPSKFHRKV